MVYAEKFQGFVEFEIYVKISLVHSVVLVLIAVEIISTSDINMCNLVIFR